MENQLSVPEFQFGVFKLPVIEYNHAELEKALASELEKYENVKVTLETLADDKKLAQSLGAQAKAISRARIDKTKELSAPITQFQDSLKSLEAMVLKVKGAIDTQVSSFEAERLVEIDAQIMAALQDVWATLGVRDEFKKSSYKDLVMLTATTPKGNLTAKVTAEIAIRANADKSLQSQTDLRLAQLESTCYKKGLAAPLTEAHIKTFLYDDDDAYTEKLNAIIASEVEREARAVEAHKAKMAAELAAKQEAADKFNQSEIERFQENQQKDEEIKRQREEIEQLKASKVVDTQDVQKQEVEPPKQQVVDDEGMVDITVICTFKLKVNSNVTSGAIANKMREFIEGAGSKTLHSVEVVRG